MSENRRVLLVDDEPNVLNGYKRHLRKQFEIECGLSGAEGVRLIQEAKRSCPFAVVVSDMAMPGMNGVEFLEQVKSLCPTAIRVMLTGNADQETATEAVNRGAIYRFLNKPCDPERLADTIENGVLRCKVQLQESAMLSKTVAGSVSLMTDILSLTNPDAFGRVANVRRIAREIAKHLGADGSWHVEMAAMLSQIGCITVAPDILKKVRERVSLTPSEAEAFAEHPRIGAGLIRRIPRLEAVAEAVEYQLHRNDAPRRRDDPKPPQAAAILKAAIDFESCQSAGMSDVSALAIMRQDESAYDEDVLMALSEHANIPEEVRSIGLVELTEGMIVEEHIYSTLGDILVPSGQEVNPSICARLKKLMEDSGDVREPIIVRVPTDETEPSLPGDVAPLNAKPICKGKVERNSNAS